MAERSNVPYLCHIMVCTYDRGGERPSCADEEGVELRAVLKTEVEARGWKNRVRVSQTDCLGQCTEGPNVMIYPQGIWFRKTTLDDVPEILATVESLLTVAE